MLVIRDEQMETFRESAEDRFVDRVVAHLHAKHGDAVRRIPDRVVRARVVYGIGRGRRHGLRWKSSLAAFVSLMFVIGPWFDQLPRVRKILSERNVKPDMRIQQVLRRMTYKDWQSAQSGSSSGEWPAELGRDA